MSEPQAVIVSEAGDTLSLDYLIAAWLHEKETRTGSKRTRVAYDATLDRFRGYLQCVGLDLDAVHDPSLEPRIADAAQAWCALRWERLDGTPAAPVTATTYNQRLAILSSFYEYARRRRALPTNPIEMVKPMKADADRSPRRARPLRQGEAEQRLAVIPTDTLAGLRDYALLAVAFNTGRRRAELAALRLGHLALRTYTPGDMLHITWPRTKGDKHMADDLEAGPSDALLAYLEALYGDTLHRRPPDAPVWASFAPRWQGRLVALGPQGIADICERWLGTRKVHTTRHNFAVESERQGAPPSLIQRRLGHSSLAVTGRYLDSLHSDENPYAARVAAAFGVKGRKRPPE